MENVAGVDGCPGGRAGAVWDGRTARWRALPPASGGARRAADADGPLGALACAWTARRVLDGTAARLGAGGTEIVS